MSIRVLYWAPRALSIAFIAFLSLFSLDVFESGQGLWSNLGKLLMHLIPSFVLVAALVLAWRWEWLGAALYAVAGVLYTTWAWQRPVHPRDKLTWILMIAGPVFLIAALFLANWLKRRELGARG